ncbi:oxidoreductase [Streptomyces sp. NBC_01190]|uniref:oxidoreductase n=1 Tax=Streptomyces sp. NBC_01190 TaxID=2903767 RepID=UPI00386C9D83|nr:oxidoreductase [Streptomyces sp. NBC_01190]
MSSDSTDAPLFDTACPIPGDWGPHRIPGLGGRLAVVTGGNTGLGLATARELARAGADVVLAVRSTGRGAAAAADIRRAAPGSRVDVHRLDLADLASVADFADRFLDEYPALDLLINNAGIMTTRRSTTTDGFESQFGTNHLGHFALTGRLLPVLAAATAARVVTVSSAAHALGRLDFRDLQSKRRWGRLRAYGNSKLANLLFTAELDRRAGAAGLALRAYAVHPGYAATSLFTAGQPPLVRGLFALPGAVLAVRPLTGALPTLCAATHPGLPGATFLGPRGAAGLRGAPAVVTPAPRARHRATAVRLWEVSQALTAVRYDFPSPAAVSDRPA